MQIITDLTTNCLDFIYNWRALVSILVNVKFTCVKLLEGLEYVNNILSTLALSILFLLRITTKWYWKKTLAKFDNKSSARFYMQFFIEG